MHIRRERSPEAIKPAAGAAFTGTGSTEQRPTILAREHILARVKLWPAWSAAVTPALLLVMLIGLAGCRPLSRPVSMSWPIPLSSSQLPASSGLLVPVSSLLLPLGGGWQFAIDSDMAGQAAGWAEPGFDDSGWTTVTVPHTWNVMPAYTHYEGLAWYRRRFKLPPAAQEAHLRLRFEAAFYLAHVWLNGIYLGMHEGGYTPFEFDVSGLALMGSDNVLAVRVDNRRAMDRLPAMIAPSWSFDWWNYGGLVRDVALQLSSRAFIAHQRLIARPALSGVGRAEEATVTARVTIMNTSHQVLEAVLTGDVRDERSGLSVLASRPTVSFSLPPGASHAVPLTTRVLNPQLWHFDRPHLYRWSAALYTRDGVPLHTAEVTLGIRSVELRGARVYLNGEPVRLVGLTRHADSPEHGLAEPRTVMAMDWADLKRLNAVLSRPVHYPQADFILDYADRHGLLLIPEVPAWQLTPAQMAQPRMRALARQQLREMITAQANHPSVWAWSVGNEIDSDTPAGHAFVRELVDVAKELDPTRPVSFVSDRAGWRLSADATALVDFVMLNAYYGTWHGPKAALEPALDAIHATWPDKPVIISEYGFDPRWERIMNPVPPDLWRYYAIPPEIPSDSEAADSQRQQLIREQIAVYRRKPFIAGAIFWTYQDYRTRSGFQMGVVDARRRRRGSWTMLRQANAPALIDALSLTQAAGRTLRATIVLRARGPMEIDLPAYTLRGYQLEWAVAAPDGQVVFAQGRLPIPTLAPGTTWSGVFAWGRPSGDYWLTVRLVRPTGFAILEQTYDAQGDRLADGAEPWRGPMPMACKPRYRTASLMQDQAFPLSIDPGLPSSERCLRWARETQ